MRGTYCLSLFLILQGHNMGSQKKMVKKRIEKKMSATVRDTKWQVIRKEIAEEKVKLVIARTDTVRCEKKGKLYALCRKQ